MKRDELIRTTEKFVRNYLAGAESGHNWLHVERVRRTALLIWEQEKRGNPFIVEMASLLHDIGDHKTGNDPRSGKDELKAFLASCGMTNLEYEGIMHVIGNISFRDNIGRKPERSPELDIVQDADRLDAIGAVGIARAFSYGGSRGHEIYDPERPPRKYSSGEEYSASDSSTINHFYEKLLLLKDSMNTSTGKAMAAERHRFMIQFLDQFFRETGDYNGSPDHKV